MTRAAALGHADKGIHIDSAHPGCINTPLSKDTGDVGSIFNAPVRRWAVRRAAHFLVVQSLFRCKRGAGMIASMRYERVISFLLAVCMAAVSLPGSVAASTAHAPCHAAEATRDGDAHRHAVPEKPDCQRTRVFHDCCVQFVAIAPPARVTSIPGERDTLIAFMPSSLRLIDRAADIYRPPWQYA